MIGRRLQAAGLAPRRTSAALAADVARLSAALHAELPDLDPLARVLDAFDAFGVLGPAVDRLPEPAVEAPSMPRAPAPRAARPEPRHHPVVAPGTLEAVLARSTRAAEPIPQPPRRTSGPVPRPNPESRATLHRIPSEAGHRALGLASDPAAPEPRRVSSADPVPPPIHAWLQRLEVDPDAPLSGPETAPVQPMWRTLEGAVRRVEGRSGGPDTHPDTQLQTAAPTFPLPSPTPAQISAPDIVERVTAGATPSGIPEPPAGRLRVPTQAPAESTGGLRGLVAQLAAETRTQVAPLPTGSPGSPAPEQDFAQRVAASLAQAARAAGIEVEP